MHRVGTVGLVAVVVGVGWGSAASACHEAIHYTKAEIEHANLNDYLREVKLRDQDPGVFDEKHPLLGQLLSSESVYEQLLAQWKSHPGKFEHEYPHLWHVLYGDELYQKKHPWPPTAVPPLGNPIPPIDDDGHGRCGGGSGSKVHDNGGGGGGGGGVIAASVPEPSSGALAATGLAAGLVAAALRRACRNRKARRALCRCPGQECSSVA